MRAKNRRANLQVREPPRALHKLSRQTSVTRMRATVPTQMRKLVPSYRPANQRPDSGTFLKLSSALGASRCETSAHDTIVALPLSKSTVFTLVFSSG